MAHGTLIIADWLPRRHTASLLQSESVIIPEQLPPDAEHLEISPK